MATAAKSKTEGEEAPAKGGTKKMLLIVLVLLLAAAGAAYFFLLSGSSAKAAEPEKGAVVALDPIAVNLAGGGYLKIGIALQLTADAGEEAPDGSPALDLIISTFSQANPADITGARDALKEALQEKIIAAYTEDDTELVMGIYFTQYVTQ
jgi:flagellar FliL protein